MVDTLNDSSSCGGRENSITLDSSVQTSNILINTDFDYLKMDVDYHQLHRRKVSNPINITTGLSLSQNLLSQKRKSQAENSFCYNSRNPALIYSENDEENDYTLLSEQSTNLAESRINNFTNGGGGGGARSRKVSAVLNTRAYAPLANLNKKKKSSSGVSSSSDDSTFAIQESYNRRISNGSFEECSSVHSSPRFHKKFSQDDGKKKIDLGYYSPRRRTNTSMENFHSAVTKKLSGKEKKESLIGMFEQISTAGFHESRTNSIYEFRKNKRRSAVAVRQQNEPVINTNKRLSMPNTAINSTPSERSDIDQDSLQTQLNNDIDDDDEEEENRRRAHTTTPIERKYSNEHYIINKQDICGENVSLETMPPPRRKLSSNHMEPRRRISSTTTLEDLDLKGTKSTGNYSQRSNSVIMNPMESQCKPKRRFSSHTPYLYQNNVRKEPMRRFSSALPCSSHHDYSEDHQKISFEELQSRFLINSESCNVDESDGDTSFVSNIDKSNNIFVAQIYNEGTSITTSLPNEDTADDEPSYNSFNLTISSDEPSRRYSYNPPRNVPIDIPVPTRKNNSLELPNNRRPSRRTSMTALENIPWGDKRLSTERPYRESTIDEGVESVSSKNCSSEGTSTYAFSVQSKPDESTYYDDEVPPSPQYRMSVRSLSSPDSSSSADESEGDEQAGHRPSVIHCPTAAATQETTGHIGNYLHSNMETNQRSDLNKRTVISQSTASSFESDCFEDANQSSSVTTSDDPPSPAKDRRRKYGITHITALENVPRRRISWMQECAMSDRDSYEDAADSYQTENSFGRRYSHASFSHQFNIHENMDEETEVVSDQATLDVILQSLDALSSIDVSDGSEGSDNQFPKSLEQYGRNRLPNLDEEAEYESPVWCLERRMKELKIPSERFFKDDAILTPTEKSKSFFNDDEVVNDAIEKKTGRKFSAMFGYFNYFLYVYIIKEHGTEKWKEISRLLELTKSQRDMFEKPKNPSYDDDLTDQLLKKSSQYLRVHFNLFLQNFGIKYFDYCSEKYGDILRSIATNLTSFINNMNDIRRHIHKIEEIPDDFPPSIYATVDKKGTLLMYYKSRHEQNYLEYFLMGFVKRAALILFDMRSRIILQHHKKNIEDYSIISIKSVVSLIKKPSQSKLQLSNKYKDLILDSYLMDQIFPFHMILNEKFEIVQLGHSLNLLVESYIPTHGLQFHSYFKLDTPMIELTFEQVRRNLNTAFTILLHKDLFPDFSFILKGQFVYLDSSKCLWFMGSPKVDYLHHLNSQSHFFLSDIPLHDVTREVLLVGEQKHSVETLKNQLQTLTNRLKETSKDLAVGKVNTENILDQMFPKDVAENLMRDLPVPAVTTEKVSILFTDIVGFTSICEQCDPEEVTIMLNKLYIDFDYLCEKYEIYKVETIGDAYMAVGGLHQQGFEHGRWVTHMGIEMINLAKNVNIPRTQNSIQIRVGIHSGKVVAGVVGTLMPRYCLFGMNVTLANKMESTSESGKVHISPDTYLEIKHHQEFIFWSRSHDKLPELMAKFEGHPSFFVTQRESSDTHMIPCSKPEKRRPYMMESRQQTCHRSRTSRVTSASRKNSRTESMNSELTTLKKLPDDLKEQFDALDKINRFDNGKIFCLSDGTETS